MHFPSGRCFVPDRVNRGACSQVAKIESDGELDAVTITIQVSRNQITQKQRTFEIEYSPFGTHPPEKLGRNQFSNLPLSSNPNFSRWPERHFKCIPVRCYGSVLSPKSFSGSRYRTFPRFDQAGKRGNAVASFDEYSQFEVTQGSVT